MNEVAAIFLADDGAPPAYRDIVVWPREQRCYRVSDDNEHIDPLTYVLLFPCGTRGWNSYLQHSEEHRTAKYQRVTCIQFYSHRLMVFDKEQVLPHGAGLLFQQYVVDIYCRAEAQRLNYLRHNQNALRADAYKDLRDAVADLAADEAAPKLGKRIVLPSSYPGSPRAMQQNYLDAMALVRKYGRPDFFITMTANPMWPEIQQELRPGERSSDRPDLVARVFRLKMASLLDDVIKKGALGLVLAYAWTVEFQKRGLPHLHLLTIVRPEDKVRAPADVDMRVCAELPGDRFSKTRQGFGCPGLSTPRPPRGDHGTSCSGFGSDCSQRLLWSCLNMLFNMGFI